MEHQGFTMIPDRLEVRNYRVFTDESPYVLPLDAAAVAFVGPNNVGKTAALRVIYELRAVWNSFDPAILVSLLATGAAPQTGSFIGLTNPAELFSNSNTAPLKIDLIFKKMIDTATNALGLARIRKAISRVGVVTVSFVMSDSSEITRSGDVIVNDARNAFYRPGGHLLCDASEMILVMRRLSGAKYITAIRSAAATAQGTLYEMPQGADLAKQWWALKTGATSKDGNDRCTRAEEIIRQVFGFEDLQVNVGDNAFSIRINWKTYRLDEIGNGFAHFLCAVIEIVLRPASLVLIDEPETGVDPVLWTVQVHKRRVQRWPRRYRGTRRSFGGKWWISIGAVEALPSSRRSSASRAGRFAIG
jgi:hypothetical protein